MCKYLFIICCLFITTSVTHAQVVKPEDAAQLIGKTITVCGEVFGGKFLETSKTSPTLLNMGASYPKQPLTIVIPIDIRKQFGFKPEELLNHKHICVTGKVTKYQKSAQIVLEDRTQLRIL
jgi:hypothetical protein